MATPEVSPEPQAEVSPPASPTETGEIALLLDVDGVLKAPSTAASPAPEIRILHYKLSAKNARALLSLKSLD